MSSEILVTSTGLHALSYFIPVIFLSLVGFIILAMGTRNTGKSIMSWITFFTLAVGGVLTYLLTPIGTSIFGGTLVFNSFGLYFALIMIISSMFICYPALKGLTAKSEIFYATLLFVTVGMILAAFSYNLITLFISFEAVSIGTYVLASFGKSRRNLEGTVKYFFTGTIATAFILLGSSFFYLGTGTFNLSILATSIATPEISLALIFLIVGFGFKLAIFSMHQWAIDTYDGAENSVSAFLSAGSKVLAYVVILKVFLLGFSSDFKDVYYLFVILSILTMTYGNISALSQNNLKRLLAYSSVAQAGYLILVLAVVSSTGNITSGVASLAIASGMFYSLVYIFMKGGSFIALNSVNHESVELADVSGLAKKSPALAVSFAILLLALAGIPLTGGFFAKYLLFLSLIEGGLWWLAVIAILNSAISVFYYFRVIMYMFGRNPVGDQEFDLTRSVKVPVYASATITVVLSLMILWFPAVINIASGLFG